MKTYFRLIFTLFIVVILSSCNQIRVLTSIPYSKSQRIRSVALMPVVIGKIDQPIFPLIDAGMFNSKTNKIANLLIDEQTKIINAFRDSLALIISNQLKINVLSGDELYENPGFGEVQHNASSMETEDKEFPYLIIPDKEKMPFICKKGNLPKALLSEENKKICITICEKLKVDAIAVSFLNLSVLGASAFGISGALATSIKVSIIDKNGKLVSEGFIVGKNTPINGKKIEDYKLKLNEYPFLAEILIKDMSGQKYKPKN
jgi:hypothetical protein